MCIMYTYMYTYLTTCTFIQYTCIAHMRIFMNMYTLICYVHEHTHTYTHTHTRIHTHIYTIFNIFGERERESGEKRERERKKEWYYGYRMSHFRNKIDMIALDSRCYVGRIKECVFLFSRGSNNSEDVNLANLVYSLQSDVMFTFEFFKILQ